MSQIVSKLQSSLIEFKCEGWLSCCSLLPGQVELLNHACFVRPVITTEMDIQWFQLSPEEAFYLCCMMRCIKIVNENKCVKEDEELWYMNSKKANFPILCKAYNHLRMKSWVVRVGSQYGVDFVAYRHHLTLVHAEYVMLVLSDNDGDSNSRLNVWSDFHCTLRLYSGVVKTLWILHVDKKGKGDSSHRCLENYTIEERIIARWNPEQSREDQAKIGKESRK